MKNMKKMQSGFTLVELMVTLGVLAILVTLATPSFTSVINSNRLSSQANELVADIQLARSEALRRNRTVRLCRSTNGHCKRIICNRTAGCTAQTT